MADSEWEQTIRIHTTRAEMRDLGWDSAWAVIVQALIYKGADVEFYFDVGKRRMDFQLRGCDRLVAEPDLPGPPSPESGKLHFVWSRRRNEEPVEEQGLYNRDRLEGMDVLREWIGPRITKGKLATRSLFDDPATFFTQQYVPQWKPKKPWGA